MKRGPCGEWPSDALAILTEVVGKGGSYGKASSMLAAAGHAYSRNACIGKARRMGIAQGERPARKPNALTRARVARAPSPARGAGGGAIIGVDLASGPDRMGVAVIKAGRIVEQGVLLKGADPVSLVELEDRLFRRCRYPIQGTSIGMIVCGGVTLAAEAERRGVKVQACAPYCLGHHQLAYRPAPSPRVLWHAPRAAAEPRKDASRRDLVEIMGGA
ncbi:hypothetical protein SAMN05519104_6689 [Rhizobiales bacterium GAS188]|nr:hypothetical protein SAMN05519104_6689 [Rhizobiales bacterium GAS188]